jgi:hypothetical protein
MNFAQVRDMAKEMGLKTGRVSKVDLIRSIQEAESNIPCFGTDRVQYCGEEGCLWRNECQNSNKA